MIRSLGLLAAMLTVIGCGNVANGQVGEAQPLRAAIGMPLEELNRQPLLARHPLSDDRANSISVSEPHRLEISIRGRTLRFEGGGGSARTYLGNAVIVAPSAPGGSNYSAPSVDMGRISLIRFDMNRELLTIDDAINVANAACSAVRDAGLRPRAESPSAWVTNPFGPVRLKDPVAEDFVRTAFLAQGTRVAAVAMRVLQDHDLQFDIEIQNYRRLRQRPRAGDSDEQDLAGERVYRVSGSLRQNLDRILAPT